METINAKRVSLKTIAEQAGLSVSAVSQILNNKPNDFSSEITKCKVREIASRFGYRPNFGYKLMRGEKTKTVSIIVSENMGKKEAHMQNIIIELMSEFDSAGYGCYLSTFSLNADDNFAKLKDLIARGVESFVLLGKPYGYEQIEDEILKCGKKYIGYHSLFKRTVNFDSTAGEEAVLRYFIGEGKNNFRILIGHEDIMSNSRFAALRKIFPDQTEDFLVKKYLHIMDYSHINDEYLLFQMGYSATAELLARHPDIQALSYVSDYFAIGGAKLLTEKGLVIGKDILVAGFNNTMAVKVYPFPITSVEHDIKQITQSLFKESFNDRPVKLMIEPVLHIRTSNTN